MKITRVDIYLVQVPMKKEARFSFGSRTSSQAVLTCISTDSGLSGWGEATPYPLYSYETSYSVFAAIERFIGPGILGLPLRSLGRLREVVEGSLRGNPIAKAGVEMALLDLYGRALNVPVRDLLGPTYRSVVTVNGSANVGPTPEVVAEAVALAEMGYRYIKVYVGRDPFDTDVQRVKAVRRELGDRAKLFIDANQKWTVKAARVALAALEGVVEFVEQPVTAADMAGMREVRESTTVPVVADEAVWGPDSVAMIAGHRSADGVNVYVSKSGGLYNAAKSSAVAEAFGMSVFIGGLLELGIATAAGLQLASTIPSLSYPCYFAGPSKHKEDVVNHQFVLTDGCLAVPEGSGLGVEVNLQRVKQLATAERTLTC